jgi:lipopolysaccharide transport system ATP-binding protein
MGIAIRVEHLSKEYRLGVINHGMLYKDMQSWVARRLGKPDPHAPIGEMHFADQSDRFWALKDLCFDIEQGDRIGIIGRNGAGKSTLLKILSRITAPTEGIVRIKGRVISLLEVGTGFHGELTGRENIYLNGAILGMKKREIDRKLDEIINFSEIEQYIDTPVKRYSSGMYVRLAFAVAAHLDSEILIADEVLAVGDSEFQKKAIGKMQDLSTGQGRTVLFVSHQMTAVSRLCLKGFIMQKGRIVFQDIMSNCIDRYLSTGSTGLSPGYWSGSEGDSALLLNKVFLSTKKILSEVQSSFKKGDKVNLNIEYTILQNNPNYVLSVEFFNKNGAQLCVNSATDFFKNDELNMAISKGKHNIVLEIDTSIFATGSYYIHFDFAIHGVKRIINESPSLSFEILSETENVGQLAHSRQDIIYPEWRWKQIHL